MVRLKQDDNLSILESNLRQIEMDARRLSEDYDYDITPSDAYGILLSVQKAIAALANHRKR